MPDDTDSLVDGQDVPLTALFLDIKDSTKIALKLPPQVGRMNLNRRRAEMVAGLRHDDSTAVRAPKKALSARKSASRNDVKNNGRHNA